MTEGSFSHLDESGSARMVDVSSKAPSSRQAVAEAFLSMAGDTIDAIREGTLSKGDALAVAKVAGIMAAKKTPELIPLCHQIAIDSVDVNFELTDEGVRVIATARAVDRTGVEMEALIAAAIASLTIYDMCKSLDKSVVINDVRLVSKTGGKSGDWHR